MKCEAPHYWALINTNNLYHLFVNYSLLLMFKNQNQPHEIVLSTPKENVNCNYPLRETREGKSIRT